MDLDFGMAFNLSIICFAEADNSNAHRSFGETQNMQTTLKVPNSNVPVFAIVFP